MSRCPLSLNVWSAKRLKWSIVTRAHVLQQVGRARAFSSFVLLVGKLTSAGTLAAHHACILQNKDELSLPLELELIPTAQVRKNAKLAQNLGRLQPLYYSCVPRFPTGMHRPACIF